MLSYFHETNISQKGIGDDICTFIFTKFKSNNGNNGNGRNITSRIYFCKMNIFMKFVKISCCERS